MTIIGKLPRLGRSQHHTVITRETIKPSSPTPCHLQTYNLSMIDQLVGQEYMPLVLFYPNNGNCSLSAQAKAQKMKKSLSQSLTRYYPFAGRLHTPTTPYVDCNDDGVVFVEAKNDTQLETFQHISEQDEILDQLFVDDLVCHNSPDSTSLVGVQLNHFACGGIAVGVSMSHVIGDGCTLASFVSHWSSVAYYGTIDHKEVMPLNPRIIHPPNTNPILENTRAINHGYANRVTKKFVFPNTKLSDLKNKVIAEGIKNPTRVEVLTSLLYKTAISTATIKSGCFKPSFLFMPVNIRNKLIQKLPQATVGNIASAIMVPTRHPTETSLSVMVAGIKNQKSQLEGIQSVQHAFENFKTLQLKMGNEELQDVSDRTYWCSSLCGFPYNKANFGWGNPTEATLVLGNIDRNGFVLTDTSDGKGIEAQVILEKEGMEIFQNDKEMLSFCQIN